MQVQTKQHLWAVIHQLLLFLSVILFPVIIVLERLGIPVSETLSDTIDSINTKYREVSDDDPESPND